MDRPTPSDTPLETLLRSALPSKNHLALRTSVIPALLESISEISQNLQTSHTISAAGSANYFGDDQLNVDVAAEDIIRAALASCPAVVTASSEEDPVEKSVQTGGELAKSEELEEYSVAFDPLDGSSIIAPNWTVGTIVGVWEGKSCLGQMPREKQVVSILGVYGPRTTAIIAIRVSDTKPLCFEVGLSRVSKRTSYTITRPSITLSSPPFQTRYFAPANLRAASESPQYAALINHYITNRYTLRYSGGLVPDLVHALVKGHGVYISPVTQGSKAKLRMLYELCPVAMVVECAGGKAVRAEDGRDMLGREVGGCDERGGLICGNEEEVELVKEMLFE